MSASASQSHVVSKEAISVVESFEKAAQLDVSSITTEAQVDKSSPSLLQQVLAYSLRSGSQYVCVGNQSEWQLISFDRPEVPAEADHYKTSDYMQISLIKNMENLLPAVIGFLGDAQQMETTQITSASSKL
ncbi:hypothetical protein CGCF415_v013145 [Colletotrichum fructicola]|uniref:Uncharacterized protein n=2 Tax=Colletotrichum gloeosporioides species complex TaxID=2707338 RepID=L2FJN9_COLFN|nr:uncharacterized protein CGMCC3_g5502 [Colletotrichum fructicola]XP_053036941.1 uncharacterized protein COL26b_006363 [Colletotrichum chrysophilum]KAF4480942.1 hypothetical protein CGGC5_v011471 [Colletotrichum fructicola Nara gc5]KAE9578593.1 hypothetical protein CGMCC3_g5502 [Colletotrichum fructicola]KAF4426278.1 hypothetical protein CFRS1_v009841 [Colletotrichum fructicola]KAF4886145.1 hypothetical protein CGCFRS4_v011442 [Colletotrichum fructicola]KAF4892144.1 hypothetical protein CGCF